jgi:hypothetical protein
MVLLDWPPPDHLWIGTKSRQFLPSQRSSNVRARMPAEILALGPSSVSPRRSSNANSLCGQNSAASRESVRPFKGIFCDDVSEFESYMPSQPVRSLPPNLRTPLKMARHRVPARSRGPKDLPPPPAIATLPLGRSDASSETMQAESRTTGLPQGAVEGVAPEPIPLARNKPSKIARSQNSPQQKLDGHLRVDPGNIWGDATSATSSRPASPRGFWAWSW